MNIVLLSGGAGQRLWPLSNSIRSKQFVKFFKTDNGVYESMVQRICRQIKNVDDKCNITIATCKSQVPYIKNQLSQQVGICVEPSRRNTFPAIALVSSYLHEVEHLDLDEVVVVCPIDPYVNDDYFKEIHKLVEQSKTSSANILLLGINPDSPSTKFGYIIPESKTKFSKVQEFIEKPSEDLAKKYISKGALWNGGVFAFKLNYILQKVREFVEYDNYKDLYNKYDILPKISFDYAILEKEPNIEVQKYSGTWKDVGTWDSLTKVLYNNTIGEQIYLNDNCKNLFVMNELQKPIICMGLKNIIVSASQDGVLISDINESEKIKPYVDKLNNYILNVEKKWGNYSILEISNEYIVIKRRIKNECIISYSHVKVKNSSLSIVSGKGAMIVNGELNSLNIGDSVKIPLEAICSFQPKLELVIIETLQLEASFGLTAKTIDSLIG